MTYYFRDLRVLFTIIIISYIINFFSIYWSLETIFLSLNIIHTGYSRRCQLIYRSGGVVPCTAVSISGLYFTCKSTDVRVFMGTVCRLRRTIYKRTVRPISVLSPTPSYRTLLAKLHSFATSTFITRTTDYEHNFDYYLHFSIGPDSFSSAKYAVRPQAD